MVYVLDLRGRVVEGTYAYLDYSPKGQICAWYGCSRYCIKGKFLKRGKYKRVYNVLFLRARMYRVLAMFISLLVMYV